MTNVFRVKKPGLFTTVQDLGRTGYQQYGMVVSGAMDPFALQIANILVGNPRNEAGLELTLMGPDLEVMDDSVIALCGADLSPMLDGKSVPVWKSFKVKKGETLHFGRPNSGSRAYLAVAGGLDVPVVMGSKSTFIKGSIGGLDGRELHKQDLLKKNDTGINQTFQTGKSLHPSLIPEYHAYNRCRVIRGPDERAFEPKSFETFFTGTYKVSRQADRMGYRLNGPALVHRDRADIISDAILPGTVQVPANGEPIILLADRQTTGGYARIGTVISVDLPYIGQMHAGQELMFEETTTEQAQALYIKQEQMMKQLQTAAGRNRPTA